MASTLRFRFKKIKLAMKSFQQAAKDLVNRAGVPSPGSA
jgi:hypothetical protein